MSQLNWFLLINCITIISCQWSNNKFWNRNKFNVQNENDTCKTLLTPEVRQLIIDYCKWKNIRQIYFVDKSVRKDCTLRAFKKSLSCFSTNGLSFGLMTQFRKPQKNSLGIVLAVTFIENNHDSDHTKEYASQLSYTVEKLFWLNIITNITALNSLDNNLFDALRNSSLDLADQLCIAVSVSNKKTQNEFRLSNCKRRYQRLSVDDLYKHKVSTDLPFFHKQNKSINVTQYIENHCHSNVTHNQEAGQFCLLQIYKLRWNCNSSLVVTPLGIWSYENGTRDLKPFQTTEKRLNMHHLPIIVGKKQETSETVVVDESLIEDVNDSENMDKIADYIMSLLNASQQTKTYSTLGKKQATGDWTGLLEGVIKQNVDFGLESVIEVPERYNDMAFSPVIMDSIRCIYLKPEESHSARDIYLVPFGDTMSLCMIGMIVIVSIFMVIYLKIVRYIWKYRQPADDAGDARLSDATIWASSIFFMQGSNITPKTSSAKIIVVSCMLFALIVNTSYQGFITSILSIKLTSIRTVDDLLDSDYDIGYAKNSQDEIFLRTQNNISQLNQIYLRGYLHNSINNIIEGIYKATKGNYGFFATGHVARKQILRLSSGKCRYDIMEIPIPSTKYIVALPMSKKSPYKKLINFCIIKMYESGIHQYLINRIAPAIPPCSKQSMYTSARINDLFTAFSILAGGIVLEIVFRYYQIPQTP